MEGAGVGRTPLLCPAGSGWAWTQAAEASMEREGRCVAPPSRDPPWSTPGRGTEDWTSSQAGMGSPWHDPPPSWFCFSSEP